MIVAVLAEFGGARLLGKAREIADYTGDLVVALCSGPVGEGVESKQRKCIALGADEVRIFNTNGDDARWVQAISQIIENESELRAVLLPSSSFICNFILGAVCAAIPSRIGSVMDSADFISESGVGKTLPSCKARADSFPVDGKVSLWSIKPSAVSEPFEDTFKRGKVVSSTGGGALTEVGNAQWHLQERNCRESASQPVILLGSGEAKQIDPGLVSTVVTKLGAVLVKEAEASGLVIYGPCLAIGVTAGVKTLPVFLGDLLSICSSGSDPIAKISDLVLISPQIAPLLEKFLNQE